jgi:alpha-L-fucosidase
MLERLGWFEEARYGLFIHWGLYAQLGGIWNGQQYPGGTEWIMRTAKIPFDEYRKLADTFDPGEFNADDWVCKALDFGCRYLCITAKHHDGFAMFDSAVSDYTIMHTPFGRDVVKELSDACGRHGLKFCVYYSQMQDWADPNGDGNSWDYDPKKKDFNSYFNSKVKPQVRELLTNYGEIGMIWFDTPYDMPRQLCAELERFVHSIQPDCVINGRIGYGLGDYRQMGDNEIPVLAYRGAWETPMTLNNTWGYSQTDTNWKSPKTVVKMLIDVASKGGNLLINVGPDAKGCIPEGSVRVLSTVGGWLKRNGESIYGTQPCADLPYQIRWGGLTRRGAIVYLHLLDVSETPNRLKICNIETRAKRAYLLSTGEELPIYQSYELSRDEYRFIVDYPKDKLDGLDTVIVVEFEKPPVPHSLYMTFDRTEDGFSHGGEKE